MVNPINLLDLFPYSIDKDFKVHDINVEYVKQHIIHIFDYKVIQDKLKNPVHLLAIQKLFKDIKVGFTKVEDLFNIDIPVEEIAYFYWIYKRNYIPWMKHQNFVDYMGVFKSIFHNNIIRISTTSIEEMKISLALVFYFDFMIHN